MGAYLDLLARLNGLSFLLAAATAAVVVSTVVVLVVVSRAAGAQVRARRARVARAAGWTA